MSEFLSILDEDGNVSDEKKERSQVHKDGDWHASIHLWVVCGEYILLQKRSTCKESYPGCYDATVAGHVSFQEKPVHAAVRESKEEIGINILETDINLVGIQKLCIRHDSTYFISNEYNYVYIYEIDRRISFKHDKEEIEELLWMTLDNAYEEIMNNNPRYCISREEAKMLKKHIIK